MSCYSDPRIIAEYLTSRHLTTLSTESLQRTTRMNQQTKPLVLTVSRGRTAVVTLALCQAQYMTVRHPLLRVPPLSLPPRTLPVGQAHRRPRRRTIIIADMVRNRRARMQRKRHSSTISLDKTVLARWLAPARTVLLLAQPRHPLSGVTLTMCLWSQASWPVNEVSKETTRHSI